MSRESAQVAVLTQSLSEINAIPARAHAEEAAASVELKEGEALIIGSRSMSAIGVSVTATFGQCAAGWVLDRIARKSTL